LNYQKLWKQLWEFSLDFRLLVTADLTPRYLSAYIPILSTSSFTSVWYNLFLKCASGLDAFSPYRDERSCPALPYRITGTPEARTLRSFRT